MLATLETPALLEQVPNWLARTPGILRAHVHGQSLEALDRRPAEGAWSQTEILAHFADFEIVGFQARVESILQGNALFPLNPDKRATDIPYAAMNPFKSLEQFSRNRERSLARIRQLSADQLACRTVHTELGVVTLGNLLAEWVIHDLGHIRQLVVTAAQTFLPATGPWRPGYTHLELGTKA